MVRSYRDLTVWQSGMDFAAECYRLSKLMPKAEEVRITGQLLRASASVPANIAEGWMRSSRKDYARFVSIARGSLAEAETFLLLSVRVGLLPEDETKSAMVMADNLGPQLNVLWRRLAKSQLKSPTPNP
ncbi:MAG TPA: four helix bundle protein [Allosphingosinicella sp.]